MEQGARTGVVRELLALLMKKSFPVAELYWLAWCAPTNHVLLPQGFEIVVLIVVWKEGVGVVAVTLGRPKPLNCRMLLPTTMTQLPVIVWGQVGRLDEIENPVGAVT